MKRVLLIDSSYEIKRAKIVQAKLLTKQEKFFEIALPNGEKLNHEPGQFVQVSAFGIGEAPISIASSPTKTETFDLCIRNVGKLTSALHRLEAGDEIGIRGPFGNGFPVRILEGNDLLLMAGGLGIVPLRSLINYVIDNRRDFGKVTIILGCRSPQDLLFTAEIDQWSKRLDLSFSCTVDQGAPSWTGNVGLITSLIPGVDLDPARTFSVVVGPPAMYSFVIKELLVKKIPEKQILVSLERHMKCGIGKCGHCQINGADYNYYCCKDGPVFSYAQVKQVKEAL